MNSEIYSEVEGSGQDVVLLHGWGMHGGLWGSFKDQLATHYRTHTLDLPGFGFSKDIKSEFTLEAFSQVVENYIKDIKSPVTLIGWSLGGLIILNILKRKNIDIDKVVFIATTPCFTKKTGWTNALEQNVFDGFAKDLQGDYKKTLKRFLSLQARGSDLAREDLRELNETLNERGDPEIEALKNGLDILSNTDLRNSNQYAIPAMIVLGEKDTLVPIAVSSEFEKMFINIEILILDKTGHAPFISKAKICADQIKDFIL